MVLGVLAVFFDPFGHRAYQHFDLHESHWLARSGCQERPWAWRMQTSSFVANLCGSAHLFDQGAECIEWIFVCWLIQRCIETEWKKSDNQKDAFCW